MDDLLNDTWSVYFHDPWSEDWTIPSYARVGDLTSVGDYAALRSALLPRVHQGIWFVFRDAIFPCWDDPANINGGCLSIKVLKQDAKTHFDHLCMRMLGEWVLSDKDSDAWQHVNGLSVSPKKNFCILKLWCGDPSLCKREQFDLGLPYDGEVIYRSNRENIVSNHSK